MSSNPILVKEEEDGENLSPITGTKKKRNRRRRKPRSARNNKVEPAERQGSKKHHDAPMTKRDLYFVLNCELVSIGQCAPAVARVTMINWDAEVILDTFVQVPVPVTDFRGSGIRPEVISSYNPQAMSFAKVRQSVHQILKGKILVGYKLQEHLTALGLTHPSTDVRDAAEFRLFQYEEIDGVTQERVIVERHLHDLAAEFLQREMNHPPTPMDICIAALDLYKTYRRDWENYLVQHVHANESQMDYFSNATMYVPQPSPFQPRSRLSSHDDSVSSFGELEPPQQENGPSWFGMGRRRQSNLVQEYIITDSMLTSEALEMLDSNRCDTASPYGIHRPYFTHPVTDMYESSSNPGSSTYYEDTSVVSDYSHASESIASSAHDEGPQGFPQPLQQISLGSSWFRFGSRKIQYPLQVLKEPMSSLTEEPDDPVSCPEQPSADPKNNEIRSQTDEDIDDDSNAGSRDERPGVSSWFSFRRPKSPRPGKKLEDSGEERDFTPARRHHGKSPSRDVRGDERAPTVATQYRGTLSLMNPLDGASSDVNQSNTSCVNRRKFTEPDESTDTEVAEPEKQSGSWFGFRRISKSSNVAKSRSIQEYVTDLTPDTNELTMMKGDEPELIDEDWMEEVLGIPNTEEKELLAMAWPEAHVFGLEAPAVGEEHQKSAQKESKWLSRFSRSSKSSVPDWIPRGNDLDFDVEEKWFDQSTISLTANQFDQSTIFPTANYPKILNPSFFSHSSICPQYSFHGNSTGLYSSRSRLETESTLPTVASEAEDEESFTHLDEFGEGLYVGKTTFSFSKEEPPLIPFDVNEKIFSP